MKANLRVDIAKFEAAVKKANLSRGEQLRVLKKGGETVMKRQKELVPVATGATQRSIAIFNDGYNIKVGPTTPYADVIEFGRSDMPQYPMQPFVRPSVYGREGVIMGQMTKELNRIFKEKGL